MTDYRFVSAPDVVVSTDGAGLTEHLSGEYICSGLADLFHAHGIIEPVPVELPEEIVNAPASSSGIVLDLGAGEKHYEIESSDMMMDGSVLVRLFPTTPEIPEEIVETARLAFYACPSGSDDAVEVALIAAKEAGL
jgi:hypothetical protein